MSSEWGSLTGRSLPATSPRSAFTQDVLTRRQIVSLNGSSKVSHGIRDSSITVIQVEVFRGIVEHRSRTTSPTGRISETNRNERRNEGTVSWQREENRDEVDVLLSWCRSRLSSSGFRFSQMFRCRWIDQPLGFALQRHREWEGNGPKRLVAEHRPSWTRGGRRRRRRRRPGVSRLLVRDEGARLDVASFVRLSVSVSVSVGRDVGRACGRLVEELLRRLVRRSLRLRQSNGRFQREEPNRRTSRRSNGWRDGRRVFGDRGTPDRRRTARRRESGGRVGSVGEQNDGSRSQRLVEGERVGGRLAGSLGGAGRVRRGPVERGVLPERSVELIEFGGEGRRFVLVVVVVELDEQSSRRFIALLFVSSDVLQGVDEFGVLIVELADQSAVTLGQLVEPIEKMIDRSQRRFHRADLREGGREKANEKRFSSFNTSIE